MDPNRRVDALSKATPKRWVVLSDDEGTIVAESDSFLDAAAGFLSIGRSPGSSADQGAFRRFEHPMELRGMLS
jgi:hypothetical protein